VLAKKKTKKKNKTLKAAYNSRQYQALFYNVNGWVLSAAPRQCFGCLGLCPGKTSKPGVIAWMTKAAWLPWRMRDAVTS